MCFTSQFKQGVEALSRYNRPSILAIHSNTFQYSPHIHMMPKPHCNLQRSPHIDMTPKLCHNLHRSQHIHSKASTNVTAPPFSLLPADTSCSPHTPVHGSMHYAGYYPSQTQPFRDPFYSLPIIGLCFDKTNQGSTISDEGAVILGEKVRVFKFLGYKHYKGMPSANNISQTTP